MYDIAPLRRFDRIITDNGLPSGAAAGIRDLGVTIDLARPAQADVLADSALG
jgi:DeoR/GlpR family transcriptional regulator of sugar metabolism